jgi:hypothetical protein
LKWSASRSDRFTPTEGAMNKKLGIPIIQATEWKRTDKNETRLYECSYDQQTDKINKFLLYFVYNILMNKYIKS